MQANIQFIKKLISIIIATSILPTLVYAPPKKYTTYKMPRTEGFNTSSLSFPVQHLEDCLGVHINTISVLEGLMAKADWETNVRYSFIRALNERLADAQQAANIPKHLFATNLYVGTDKKLKQADKFCIEFAIALPKDWRTDARPNELLSTDPTFATLLNQRIFAPRKALFNRALCETLAETLSSTTGLQCELQWLLEGRLFATVNPRTAAISLDLEEPSPSKATSGPRPPERRPSVPTAAPKNDDSDDELANATDQLTIDGVKKRLRPIYGRVRSLDM